MNPANIQQHALDDLAKYREDINRFSLPEVTSFANHAVTSFFEYHSLTRLPLRESVELLCEINSHPDANFSKSGLDALFPNLIEKLNDSFDPALCEIYDRVFAQVISFCRQLPEMKAFDEALSSFNLSDEYSLFHRKRNLVKKSHLLSNVLPLKKILFLSRVTIGADVAITSVLIAQLKRVFPEAELVFLGSTKLRELYGGDERVRICEISYGRGATLNSRLLSWLSIIDVVNKELIGLNTDQFCIFDPDSRLSQLGLLPICKDDSNYFFFESRSFQSDGHFSLGQLSSVWVNEICESLPLSFPFIALPEPTKSIGKVVTSHLNHPIISLSFGVGGNEGKRVNFDFEIELVRALLKSYTVILDSGFSPTELTQSYELESVFSSDGMQVLRLSEDSYRQFPVKDLPNQQIIFWEGGIGSFAALISCSDQYIGYDSSGQHLAAALGVPVFTIFSDSSTDVFTQRWQPWGRSKVISVSVKQSSLQPISEIISSILSHLLP